MPQQLPSVSELITTTTTTPSGGSSTSIPTLTKSSPSYGATGTTTPSPSALPKKLSNSPHSPKSIVPRISSTTSFTSHNNSISYNSLPHPPLRRLTEPNLPISSTSNHEYNNSTSITTSPSSAGPSDYFNYHQINPRSSISSSIDPLSRTPPYHYGEHPQQLPPPPPPHHHPAPPHHYPYPPPPPHVYYQQGPPPQTVYMEGNYPRIGTPGAPMYGNSQSSPPINHNGQPGPPVGMYPHHPQQYHTYYTGQVMHGGPTQGNPGQMQGQVPLHMQGQPPLPHQQDGRRNHQQHHTLQHHQHVPIPSHIHFDENQALVNKRRIIKRRTRTGCLTCRKRRIKCDERKPSCFNCERSKKVCLGYENLSNLNMGNGFKRKKSVGNTISEEDGEVDFRQPLPPQRSESNEKLNLNDTGDHHYHLQQTSTNDSLSNNGGNSNGLNISTPTSLPPLSLPPPISYSHARVNGNNDRSSDGSSGHLFNRSIMSKGSNDSNEVESSTGGASTSSNNGSHYLPANHPANYSMNKVSVHDLIR
ncbi:hypothetical protein DFJ63DRAFT_314356 [Scheffersomyces coipomensis]|uniref:uncharacterized protein n=1 Tax=Scheffersomyces coipomensis TaxID=1788519 RepID=UPI00315CFD96